MTHTYTINNTTVPNGGTVTLNTGIINGGTSGQIYTTTGINGTAWATPNNNFVSNNGKAVMTIPADGQTVILEKEATLEVKGNVVINGIDLEERLKTIEKVLQIPERDVKLEKKYPKLKKLYDEYIQALGKYKTFEAIKGDDNGTS